MKKRFRLYAMKATEETVAAAASERFSRITASYVLIYKNGKKPENSVEIAGGSLRVLSSAEREWILDCNTLLILEATAKKGSEIRAAVSEKISVLERELEAQRIREERHAKSQ